MDDVNNESGSDLDLELTDDKTVGEDEGEDDPLGDIPDEDEDPLGDKKPEKKEKPKSSEIAQKIKYREKSKRLASELAEKEAEIERLKKSVEKAEPGSEQEKAARKYISELAEEVYESKQKQTKLDEQKKAALFEEKVDDVLTENPDIPEAELLEIIEELDVEPAVAAKVWKRGQNSIKPKPKLPNPKRTVNTSGKMEYNKEDRGKSMFQVGREAVDEAKKKGWIT